MKRFLAILLLTVVAFVAGRFSQQPDVQAQEGGEAPKDVSCGDANGDGHVFAILDAVFLLQYGLLEGEEPPCFDAADVDDSGVIFAILDALYVLEYGFTEGPDPPDPGPDECGPDPTEDDLDCENDPEDLCP